MSTRMRVALVQHLHTADPTALIHEAAAAGADIVLFPEMWSNGYLGFDRNDPGAREAWRAGAIAPEGHDIAPFREAARAAKVHVVATLLEAAKPDPYNTALLIAPDGNTLLRHRKIHTCFFENPEEACAPGTDTAVSTIETSNGSVTVGVMICMDREYPEVARSLSQAGAEVILVPNACYLVDDPDVGDVRLAGARGRAFEDVVGIAVANYPAPRFDGHSFAVGPLGEIVTMADTGPQIAYADCDLDHIRKVRREDWFRWRDRDYRPTAAE